MLAWLAVSLVLLSFLVRKALSIRRSLAAAVAAPDWLRDVAAEAAAALRMKRAPRILLCDFIRSAAVFGPLRPVILLPTSWTTEYTREQLFHILLHESAHIRRGDLAANAGQALLHIAFWFHPFVWLAGGRARELRELCCDVKVSLVLGQGRTPMYRETLIAVARKVVAPAIGLSLGLLGLFESPSGLSARLEYLARRPFSHRRLRFATATLAALSAILLVVPMAHLKAGQDDVSEDGFKPVTAPFAVEVEPGVRVELAGVSQHPSSDDGWWAPDGSPLPEPLIDPGTIQLTSPRSAPYVFVYRIVSDKSTASRWRVTPNTGALGSVNAVRKGVPASGLSGFAITIPEDAAAAQVSIGVSTGEWVEVAQVGPYAAGIGDKRGGIAFAQPVQSGDSVVVTASDGFSGDHDRRIVVVDKQEELHEGTVTGTSGGGVHLTVATFSNLSVADIRFVRLEVRGYRWATFSGVSLARGRATQVLSTVGESPTVAPAEPARGARVFDVWDILAARSDRSPEDAGYELAASVMASVAPDAWNKPPSYNTVRYYTGGRLIVNASDPLMDQVRDHLSVLRGNP